MDQIMKDLIEEAPGSRAAIFLDMDGESITQAGETTMDMKLLGAWKEIHLDQIKEISSRIGMGTVHAVLFSMEDGNELIAPVAGEYCLLLFLSPYADIRQSIIALKKAVELLKRDIE